MGYSFFFKTRGASFAQAWLFAACLLLCLRPGDSLQCKKCDTLNTGGPCNPPDATCNSVGDNAVCMTGKLYVGDQLVDKLMTCFDDKAEKKACGNTGRFFDTTLHFETFCCSDGDFCNNEM